MTSEHFDDIDDILLTKSKKKGFNLLVKSSVILPSPISEAVVEKVTRFWKQRGIVFSDVTGETMLGKRGSLWWNLFTFDMRKVCAELTVNINRHRRTIECSLNIKTTFQLLTPMNKMYWTKEMAVFESYLRTGDEKKEKWAEFKKEYRKDNFRWALDMLILGGVTGGLFIWWLLSILNSFFQ